MPGELRRRKRAEKEAKKKADSSDSDDAKKDGEETLSDTFFSHPLIVVLPYVLLPYLVYRSLYFFRLQHPLPGFRPAVAVSDERQLLVVGTMSVGTVQVATDLYKTLNIEVDHEAADASWYFVRDGTVSWFHGTRFASEKPQPQALAKFCTNMTLNMGFHPNMYRSTSPCESTRSTWNSCWASECFKLLAREWSCASPPGSGDENEFEEWQKSSSSCETPFRRTLHQVRHPLQTVESLVTKFCVGGVDGTVHEEFQNFMPVVVPSLEETDSCIEAAVKYVVSYTRSLMKARVEDGQIYGMYQVERTTPCEIARMAGFLEESTAVYGPHVSRLQSVCADPSSPANKRFLSEAHTINRGQLTLTWEDLLGGRHGSILPDGDTTWQKALHQLTLDLGYDPDKRPDAENDENEFASLPKLV